MCAQGQAQRQALCRWLDVAPRQGTRVQVMLCQVHWPRPRLATKGEQTEKKAQEGRRGEVYVHRDHAGDLTSVGRAFSFPGLPGPERIRMIPLATPRPCRRPRYIGLVVSRSGVRIVSAGSYLCPRGSYSRLGAPPHASPGSCRGPSTRPHASPGSHVRGPNCIRGVLSVPLGLLCGERCVAAGPRHPLPPTVLRRAPAGYYLCLGSSFPGGGRAWASPPAPRAGRGRGADRPRSGQRGAHESGGRHT